MFEEIRSRPPKGFSVLGFRGLLMPLVYSFLLLWWLQSWPDSSREVSTHRSGLGSLGFRVQGKGFRGLRFRVGFVSVRALKQQSRPS